MKRIIRHEHYWRHKVPLRFVTPEEIEFTEKVFNREDGLHLMGISLTWSPNTKAQELKAEFHTNEDIPANRFANLFAREDSSHRWKCVASGIGTRVSEIVAWVEATYQETLGMAYWEYVEDKDGNHCRYLVPATPEYFLGLDESERLKWGEFFRDTYFAEESIKVVGISPDQIEELSSIQICG